MRCSVEACTRDAKHRGFCGAHYQAMWKAGALPPRERAIPFVCPADHRHGEVLTCYNHHGCRCDDCYANRSEDNEARARRVAYGRTLDAFVDADPIREHIRALSAAGIGRARLIQLTGLSRNTVKGITGKRRGKPVARVRKETAAAILAVTTTAKPAAGALVPARGAHRRLQALIARGWTERALNDQLGLLGNNMSTWFGQELMTQERVDQIADMYSRLWDQAPQVDSPHKAAASRIAMNRARREGWPAPLAWDDIDADDAPPAIDVEDGVDETAVELAILGEKVRLTPAERRIAVTRLHARRWSDQRIAATLHCADRTVFRIRGELGLEAFPYEDLVQAGAA